MLSRRNVRIKVMQALYAQTRDPEMDCTEVLKLYRRSVERSFELYLYSLLLLRRTASYAHQDEARKHSKLRPSEEDLRFSAKLATNELIDSLSEHDEFQRYLRKYHIEGRVDKDNIRAFYSDFAKTDEYKAYIDQENCRPEDHKNILLALYKHCLGNELYEEVIQDHHITWTDDRSLIVGAMKKTIKALPAGEHFFEPYLPGGETVEDLGEVLLNRVCTQDRALLDIIEPALQNWDAERVAIIDMILLKMALGELLAFPTIPAKVTLNEYVEISKLYSTDKSKDFINGILDRLMKKLQEEGKIKKEGRGLME